MPNGSKGHLAALDILVLSVSYGSEAAADKWILSVCFGEFIADGYCKIQNLRIFP